MADFKQAIEWMKEGKKVRRKTWGNKLLFGELTGNMIYFMDGERYCEFKIFHDLESIEANDWEIFEEADVVEIKFDGKPGSGKTHLLQKVLEMLQEKDFVISECDYDKHILKIKNWKNDNNKN